MTVCSACFVFCFVCPTWPLLKEKKSSCEEKKLLFPLFFIIEKYATQLHESLEVQLSQLFGADRLSVVVHSVDA